MSFITGMLVEKCRYHLPLYRQHLRRLEASGITVVLKARLWKEKFGANPLKADLDKQGESAPYLNVYNQIVT